MRPKLTVPCLLILNCLSSFASSTFAQQDDAGSRVVESTDPNVTPSGKAAATADKNAASGDSIWQVYFMQHVDAVLLSGMLNRLIRTDPTTVVADAATNSIIARGSRKDLEWIEALLLRLDLPAAKQLGGGSGFDNSSTPATSPHVDVESLRRNVKQAEEHTAKIAHEANASSGESRNRLRSRLHREVEFSFEARQQLQRAELRKVREQLTRIEQSIETRERLKDEIIDRRVDELLNPDVRWTPSGGDVSARAITTDTGKVIELRGLREDVNNAREAIEQSHSQHDEPNALH